MLTKSVAEAGNVKFICPTSHLFKNSSICYKEHLHESIFGLMRPLMPSIMEILINWNESVNQS